MQNLSLKELKELAKKLREEGVTQRQIAQEAGCTERYVQMVFAGNRNSKKVLATAKQLLADKSTETFSKAIKKHTSIIQML